MPLSVLELVAASVEMISDASSENIKRTRYYSPRFFYIYVFIFVTRSKNSIFILRDQRIVIFILHARESITGKYAISYMYLHVEVHFIIADLITVIK